VIRALLLITLLAGCGLERLDHPLAVARADVRAVCQGDDHQTVVHLSALDSSPRARLPGIPGEEGACLTELRWSVAGTAWKVQNGELVCRPPCPYDAEEPLDCPVDVTFAADHGFSVTLAVVNDRGETDIAALPFALTTGGTCE